MKFYAKFTELVRLCLDTRFSERTSWKPYRREIVETLLKSALLAVSNMLLEDMSADDLNSSTIELFDKFLEQSAAGGHQASPGGAFRPSALHHAQVSLHHLQAPFGKTAIDWITEYTLADITYYSSAPPRSASSRRVSCILGFSNTSFFGKYVREHLHMSPLKYRESVRKRMNGEIHKEKKQAK